jgi:serine protein kinase
MHSDSLFNAFARSFEARGQTDLSIPEYLESCRTDTMRYANAAERLLDQGILEFVEMFKAPIKMLHPLLTATQEGNYIGTENIGAVPFSGIILAHSNEAEWQSFKSNKNNEAFIDRVCIIKVPYCLRVTEEQKIYEKLIQALSSPPHLVRRQRWRHWRAFR